MPPRFQSFKDYQDYLLANYALIAANARDPTRIEPLEICSTQSTGYDTTAVMRLRVGMASTKCLPFPGEE